MTAVYDNWERLVGATLRREELRLIALRTPSDLSSASLSSSASSSFHLSSNSFSSLLIGDSYTYDQILQATDNLSISNIIFLGRSGDLFYGVLEGWIRVIVKKINLSLVDKEFYLIKELEFYGKISHSRFVPLLGHCMEIENHMFLVYKYMPHMDLSNFLHRKIFSEDDDHRIKSSNWKTRLKIATGAAEGLCYLHHECVPPLVHRNIEASSILLDHNFEVRLGRVIEVCIEEKSHNRIAKLLTLQKGSKRGISGTFDATRAFDVYCFGEVLLELVTGKPYSSAAFKDFSLEWMANPLANITTVDKQLILKIVDPYLVIDENDLEEVWAIAYLARACLNPKPSKRPEMTYILQALENPSMVVTNSSVGARALAKANQYYPRNLK